MDHNAQNAMFEPGGIATRRYFMLKPPMSQRQPMTFLALSDYLLPSFSSMAVIALLWWAFVLFGKH